eukprot:878394-Prymnesium_polylepis.1
MFDGCSAFTGDLSRWDVSKVVQAATRCVKGAAALPRRLLPRLSRATYRCGTARITQGWLPHATAGLLTRRWVRATRRGVMLR